MTNKETKTAMGVGYLDAMKTLAIKLRRLGLYPSECARLEAIVYAMYNQATSDIMEIVGEETRAQYKRVKDASEVGL
jgi:hypothetical protein